MGRRKKPKKRLPRTLRHLETRAPDEYMLVQRIETGVPPGRVGLDRLCWDPSGPAPFDPEDLATVIEHPNNSEVRYFCDANFFIAPTPERVWRALLSRQDRLVLVPPIYDELRQWMDQPKCNFSVHEAVRRSVDGNESPPVRIFDPSENPERVSVIEYYVNLVGHRKRLHASAQKILEGHLGREPSAQEISNFCKDVFGMRSQMLARNGAQATVPEHRYNDEALVVMAVVDAICSGKEAVILTTDEHVFEQFYKTLWIIDTHYRAMLLAERYVNDPLYFIPTRVERDALSEPFDGEVLLLTKPSMHLRELLPRMSTPVPISCMLMKNGQLHQLTFGAETQMSGLFTVKANTGGRNTSLFGDRNCHVWLAGWMKRVGNMAAIAHDRSFSFEGWTYSISLIDLNLAAYSREGFSKIRVVDPNTLLLPPRW